MSVSIGGRSLLDTLLDRAVVPGYTRLGFRLRQFGWADIDPAPDALRGRTALVTGANRGIGQAVAAGLARLAPSTRSRPDCSTSSSTTNRSAHRSNGSSPKTI